MGGVDEAPTDPLRQDFFGLGTTAAVLTVEVQVTAMRDAFSSGTLTDETYELVPVAGANPTFAFEAEIDDALAGQALRNVETTVVIRGVQANHTVKLSGDSYFTIPHLVEDGARSPKHWSASSPPFRPPRGGW